MRLKLINILLILGAGVLYSQQPHSIRYTTTEGLPSNEAYTVFQDKNGFIWFGTDRGVVKYDGYNFKNFTVADGLTKLEISDIQTDKEGNLWFSSYFGEVFYFKNEKFYPYQYNTRVKKYNKGKLLSFLNIDNEGNFLFSNYNGIFSIDKNGKEKIIIPPHLGSTFIVQENKKYYIGRNVDNKKINNEIFPIYLSDEKIYNLKINKDSYGSNKQDILEVGSKIIIAIDTKLLCIENGKIIAQATTDGGLVNNIELINNDLFICTQNGIEIHREWATKGFSNRTEKWFRDRNVSDLFIDKSQGTWVTTAGDGIFYMPKANVPNYLPEENITSMAAQGDILLLGTAKGQIVKLDDNAISEIKNIGIYSKEITIDSDNHVLFSSNYRLDFNNNKLAKNHFHPTIIEKKKTFKTATYASVGHLLAYNSQTKEFNKIENETRNFSRIFDLCRDKNKQLWIGTDKGLKKYINDTFIDVRWNRTLAAERINTIDQMSTGDMAIGTKGFGIFIGKDADAIQLKSSNGLTSDLINYIWVDANDNIWAATNNGLNKITRHEGKYKIKQIHTADGLPSEEVNKILIHNGHIYLTTNNGLCQYRDEEIVNKTTTPQIESIFVNDIPSDNYHNLKYNENNLLFKFINFDYLQGKKVKYRYKIDLGDWQFLPINELKFNSLKPGDYKIHVQAQNKDGLWSESLITKFSIENVFFKKAWFLTLMAMFIASIAYYIHILSIKNAIAKEAINSQLQELQKKAAIAQFNPHFIFNATSTIQYYIATKDLKAADSYLTDFTFILRKNIENASANFCLLANEIELVKKYIILEQKRFDDKFSFDLKIDDSIDPMTTRVPSMIFFTLCDEAINARLMHRSGQVGRLIIHIKYIQNSLIIEVHDNGKTVEIDMELESKTNILKDKIDFYGSNPFFDIVYETKSRNDEGGQEWNVQEMWVKEV